VGSNYERAGRVLSSFAFPTLPLVVGYNDVFTRDGVVHLALMVREEVHEAPIENAGGDEGVDVADGEA